MSLSLSPTNAAQSTFEIENPKKFFRKPPKRKQGYRQALRKRREARRIKRLQEIAKEQMCQELYETIRKHKTRKNRLLCRSFIRAPNRISLPDYYDIVTSPIDLLRIQQKLETKEYRDNQQFTSDVELMVSNAKSYYKESSHEYQDACELWKVFSDAKIRKEEFLDKYKKIGKAVTLRKVTIIKKKKSHPAKRIRKKLPKDRQFNAQWLLFETVQNFINSKGFKLSELFWTLPSQSYYPDYYKEIKHPISLFTIGTKINQHQYSSLDKVVVDMNLMFKYAKMYNIANSKLFKGVVMIEKFMQDQARTLINIKPPMKDYKDQVQKQQEETHFHLMSNGPQSLYGSTLSSTSVKNENHLYECLWDNCNHQFENHCDLNSHLAMEPNGHIWQTYKNRISEFKCLWHNCERNFQPFQNFFQLVRHVKKVHLWTLSKNVLPALQKKFMLCHKVIGIEYPSMKDKHPTSQIPCIDQSQTPLIDFPQGAPIKQEVILPDDGTNPSFINPSSELTRVEMTFCVDQDLNTTEPGCVLSDTHTAMDETESIVTTPDAFVHTQASLQSSICPLYTKYQSIGMRPTPLSDNDTSGRYLQPHAIPERTMQMRELPYYPNPQTKIRPKTTLHNGPPQILFTKQLQPVITQQVPSNAQSQQSNNQVQVTIVDQSQSPLNDFPQVASIKQELILPNDGTSPSPLNSSLEPTRVEIKFCMNRDKSAKIFSSVPSDSYSAMNVTENIAVTPDAFAHTRTSLTRLSGQMPSSTSVDMTMTCDSDITPTDALPVDLNLVKKEVIGETLCH